MTSFQKLQRRIGGFPIEFPAAALMAGAVALATMALPDWRFQAAVNATGLPGIISAAQPPLGTTARLLAALALAALSFVAVWVALRALDAKPQADDFPAFRAADLHPDAPRRRPILAGAEFGAPADDLPSIEEQVGRRRPAIVSEPMPSFLSPEVPQPEGFLEPRFESGEPDAEAVWPLAEPVRSAPARPTSLRESILDDEPASIEGPAPIEKPAPIETPVSIEKPIEPVAPREMAFRREDFFPPEPTVRPAPAASREPIFPPEAVVQSAPVVQPAPVVHPALVVPSKPADDADEEESVTELMARLESGLSERGARPLPGPSGSAQEELRRALGDLNRVSGRG